MRDEAKQMSVVKSIDLTNGNLPTVLFGGILPGKLIVRGTFYRENNYKIY